MSPELKDKWMRSLRSGNYKQGRGHLRTFTDELCCLGVLADVNGEKWQKPGKKTGVESYFFEENHIGKYGSLPPRYDKIIPPHQRSILMMMNDAVPQTSFKELADWIEKHV